MRKRLTSEERKRIIQVKAMEIFLEKGYKNTTMQDIVKASGLSIGGLYHHYKKTSEILYDIMVLGCEYRFNEIDKQVEVQSGNLTEELMAKIIVDKCLDDNKYMPIYVMLLQEIQDNDELRDLYLGMKELNVKKIQSMLKLAGYQELSMDRYNYLTDMINSIILACGLLGIRESFNMNRYLLEEMFLSLLKKEE
ncbi:TetR/AcrR family transcriptional regulator [Peptostreptococcus stomatis]|uniref:TetR/AcrR family transcriptional regulator n=1 Tax=Peptostreptococcus stomatis TaxID=341694 RepID=UPI0028DB448B|nr:TetR/AcrR family transcriptional regulator [Peptostreptococcus stomatis]